MSTRAHKPESLCTRESVSTYVREPVNMCAYKSECACMRACECVAMVSWVHICVLYESVSDLHQKTAEV